MFIYEYSIFFLHYITSKNGLLYSTFKYKYGQIVWGLQVIYEFSFALLFKIISTKVKEK